MIRIKASELKNIVTTLLKDINMMNFCLVGAGRAGLIHARNIQLRIKNAQMIAVCDVNQETVDQVAAELDIPHKYTDYREAVAREDVDAVVIVSPTFLHRDIAVAAAQNGKHIFLEKPMAITVEECREINAAAAEAGVTLQIGFMRRFHQPFVEAKELLDSGEMGRVMIVKSTGRGPGLPSPWMYDIKTSNGILAEVNSHDFDSVRWLVGSNLKRVYAEADNFKCPDASKEHPDFYDNSVVNLRFENGTLGTIDGTCPCHYGYDARIELLCENGVLLLGDGQEPGLSGLRRDGQAIGRAVKSWRNLFATAYLAEMESFVQSAIAGTTPLVTGEDGLQAVAAVIAANRSIETCLPINL